MRNSRGTDPVAFKGVMVSSTFTDLVQHRRALIRAIEGQDLKAVVMESDSARPAIDVIDSSLEMVRKAAAYVSVISHKYGQVPEDAVRNPDGLSLTELEFNEARRLNRPVLLFIMGPDHDVKPADVETDPNKRRKLEAFRENAKPLNAGSAVHRIYAVFNNLQEFERKAIQSVAELRRHLDLSDEKPVEKPQPDEPRNAIPAPPALYAEPPYIGSHDFIGRQSQLETLSDWASAADPHPVLLFEAIGGAGKSMLTWEWTTKHATTIRQDWAGRFWYSFYEKGAVMADFCQRALAYMTGRPLKELRRKKTLELGELLLQELRARPWLLVLDGLERVLVAYHRIDAAQLTDEEAGTTDKIARRDPCAAIRSEDEELLRALASAAPSKLLLTSRLIPRVLLNRSSQPIPGVLQERLPGLRPADAEALLRSCGIRGTSEDIQNYLKSHCDCHPLVTGVLAGLINNYLPDRGNFDAWSAAPDGGAALNLADLDLVQKRNHILRAALDALPEESRQLLSTLALVSESVDYETLCALNRASTDLSKIVLDLERRGLLQYDHGTKRYDLHPVVRGVAAGGLQQSEKETYGQRVVDYFSQQSHDPYDNAETLEDVSAGLHVVRTLIQMGHYEDAVAEFRGGVANALWFNLESHTTVLSVLRPFFLSGWGKLPTSLDTYDASYLANRAGAALDGLGELTEGIAAHTAALSMDLQRGDWWSLGIEISNITHSLARQNRLAAVERCETLCRELAIVIDEKASIFSAELDHFVTLVRTGRYSDAERSWKDLDAMGRNWPRPIYRPGSAEAIYAEFRFFRGDLEEEHLQRAERLAQSGKGREIIRQIHRLRGELHVTRKRWVHAAVSLSEAATMSRAIGHRDVVAETLLALANLHLGRLPDPRQTAEELSLVEHPSHLELADLWLAIGDRDEAKKHALAAYKWAWADGEPYVRRYYLDKARNLLQELGAEIPHLPPYDPAKDPKLPWEDDVAAAIDKLRGEKATPDTGRS